MRIVNFTNLGGLFVYQDTLEFLQAGNQENFTGIASFIGHRFVLSGCVVDTIANTITNGYIVVNNEILPFLGGNITPVINIETIVTDEAFDDGTIKPTYTIKRAKLGNITAGPDDFNFTELQRLPLMSSSLMEAIENLATISKSTVQLEPEVILSGLAVSNINTGATTLDIAAGVVLFNGQLLKSAAYSGAYPVHLKPDGSWVTGAAPAGLSITFDPHTSQRYINVLDRAFTPSGRIITHKTLTDRFDMTNNGLGRWEMKGFRLLQAIQARVPVGLWWDGVAVTNVTDPGYAATPFTVGSNSHTVNRNNIEKFTVSKPGSSSTSGVGNPVAGGSADDGAISYDIGVDAPTPIDHRQPSLVIVYIERI